ARSGCRTPPSRRSWGGPMRGHEVVRGGRGLAPHPSRALPGLLDLDLPPTRDFRLGQADLEHAVLELGADLVEIHGAREAEGALEGAIAPLVDLVAPVLLLELVLLGAADREEVVLDIDLEVVAVDPRDLGGQHERIAGVDQL